MSSAALFRPSTEIVHAATLQSDPSFVSTSLGTVSLCVTGELENLKTLWESLQAAVPCTAAQTYEWGRAWAEHVLAPRGDKPVIVVGYGPDGTPLFLWPFEMGTRAGFGFLKWLGQDHANYSMGLFAPEAARGFHAYRYVALIARSGAASGRVGRPFSSHSPLIGMAFPTRSPCSPISALPIAAMRSSSTASTPYMRANSASGPGRPSIARSGACVTWAPSNMAGPKHADNRLALLETFFAQKSRQFAAMGVKDVFDEASARVLPGPRLAAGR